MLRPSHGVASRTRGLYEGLLPDTLRRSSQDDALDLQIVLSSHVENRCIEQLLEVVRRIF